MVVEKNFVVEKKKNLFRVLYLNNQYDRFLITVD